MKLKEYDFFILKGLICFLLFMGILYFKYLPFQLLNINIENIPTILNSIYTIAIELLLIVLIFKLYKDYIKKSWEDFKVNKNLYLKKYLKYWFVILFGTAFLNLIISNLNNGNIAENEEAVRDLLQNMPIYTWIASVLIAPVLEELIFRLSLKSVFKYKWLFIILSGLIFGSFHVVGSSSIYELLYLLPYSLPGCIFAYVLWESNNIFTTIGLHMLHNGITIGLQIFIAIFGVGLI